jgi:GntR family transcriptional regulator, rspAB operon transcriptional repressor
MNESLPFEAGRTISSQVYSLLRRDIVEHHMKPNLRLSEASLCEKFNVSRQPIREVLLRLSGDKLVQIHPQRGSFVSPVSLGLFHAAQLIREAVEVDVVSRVAATATRDMIERLREELTLQATFQGQQHIERFYESDERFHAIIAGASGIPVLWTALLEHKIHLDRVRYMSLSLGQNRGELVADHEAIFEAISARDGEGAQNAMRRHLRRVLGHVGSLMREHADWFSE